MVNFSQKQLYESLGVEDYIILRDYLTREQRLFLAEEFLSYLENNKVKERDGKVLLSSEDFKRWMKERKELFEQGMF